MRVDGPPALAPGRAEHEIAHGRMLAAGDAESIWGWGSPAGQVRARRRAALIANGGGLGPGVRALELGCGTGLFTEMLAATAAEIVAIDISAELLEQARARALPPDRVRFVCARFEDCTTRDVGGPADAIVGSSVLHHLDLDELFPAMWALLRPGGWISFAEPNMLNPQILLQKNVPALKARMGDSPDETAFVRWRLRARLEHAGFAEVEIVPFDWLHPAVPARLIPAVSRMGGLLERIAFVREFAGSLLIRARRPAGARPC